MYICLGVLCKSSYFHTSIPLPSSMHNESMTILTWSNKDYTSQFCQSSLVDWFEKSYRYMGDCCNDVQPPSNPWLIFMTCQAPLAPATEQHELRAIEEQKALLMALSYLCS